MQQLTQQLKAGDVEIRELPWPATTPSGVLVRNHYSLISAGTEGSTVKAARKSLIGKAKERPQQVKQVLEVLRSQGPLQTYRAVMKKLDAYSPLGYSCAGEVVEVGPQVTDIKCGDFVACGGLTANHAEIVSVPINLCVRLPQNADVKQSCYNTLGAIAMQGIRQADLRLGESCAVIGLGLIGQLTCLMLRAGGISVYGVDVDEAAAETARKHCADAAWNRDQPGIADKVFHRTGGLGVDAVIITAGTSSLDPINLAGEIARKRGRVVVVGAVPTGFDRDPHWYRKELELPMSCSYGPGRYDPQYEEKGIDYPPAYVRWTEKRNMEAFQHLIHTGRIDLGYLTTHTFPLEKAADAYEMILARSEPFLGVVLQYDTGKPLKREKIEIRQAGPVSHVGLAFIGAGSYAQGNLLPNLPKHTRVTRRGVLTQSGTTSRRVAERFGFDFCTSEPDEILEDDSVNTIFVATRHDTHAQYVLAALRKRKHVFVEKPLCIRAEDLVEIESLFREANAESRVQLMVGFNRRFAPSSIAAKKRLGDGPMSMVYRINAGSIPADSWIQDPEIGGGRILGEVCHFVDLLTWFCGSQPQRVSAIAMPDAKGANDTVTINLGFMDGSIGTIHYFANGAKNVQKEYVELYQSGQTLVLIDFRELTTYGGGKRKRDRLLSQDKGQAAMVSQFVDRILKGGFPLIPPEDLFSATRCCFGAVESLQTGCPVDLLT